MNHSVALLNRIFYTAALLSDMVRRLEHPVTEDQFKSLVQIAGALSDYMAQWHASSPNSAR